MNRERIIVNEGDGADLLPDIVTREAVPANDVRLLPAVPFVGTGPGRGRYEAAVEYIPPEESAAA